jgi:hypothetical protein
VVLPLLSAASASTVLNQDAVTEHACGPVRFRELPCTYVPIILDLESGWRIADGRRPGDAIHLGSFVAGITDGPVLIEHPGSARCLQIDLAPLAARRRGLRLRGSGAPGPGGTCSHRAHPHRVARGAGQFRSRRRRRAGLA